MGLFDFLKKKEPVQPEVQQPSSAPVNPVSTYPVNFNEQQPVAPVEPTVPAQTPVVNNMEAMPLDTSNTTNQQFSAPVQTPAENMSSSYTPSTLDMPTPASQAPMSDVPSTMMDSTLPTLPSDYSTVTSIPSMDAMPNPSVMPDLDSSGMGSTMTEPTLNTGMGAIPTDTASNMMGSEDSTGVLNTQPMANPNPAPMDSTPVPSNGAY
jgi:hypothetical protein